ncbi:MAG TPA: hypothetical protein VGG19_02905 [Tepidisphaeraceae bacterium]|jgi:hypothetical protein
MKNLKRLAIPLALLPLLLLMGQEQPAQSADESSDIAGAIAQALLTTAKPSTKLEEFSQRKNAVIVRGFTDVSTIPGEDGASLAITAVELQDITNQTKEYGLVIHIDSGHQRTSLAYIDLDEIDALTNALDYLQKVDKPVTQLANFEAQYRTRGDLWLTNGNANGTRLVAIRTTHLEPAGEFTSAIAYFRPASLADIRQQIINAKQMLDKLHG